MTHDIAFLHTGAAHVDTFGALMAERRPSLRVRHVVAEHFLTEARVSGMTADLARRVQDTMIDAASTGAAVVVCTCSTIGAAAEATETGDRFIAMRIDRPMADHAVGLGPRVLIVAALGSTLAPTRALLEDSASRAAVGVEIHEQLIEGAWVHFERGDREQYYRVIATALASCQDDVDSIILAQASMAPAAARCSHLSVPILSSPRMGVDAALDRLAGPPAVDHDGRAGRERRLV